MLSRLIFVTILAFLLPGVFPEGARADRIVLANGDRISGTVVRLAEGTLTLETDYAGPIQVRQDAVREIYTGAPVSVHLVSGEVLRGYLSSEMPGEVRIESEAWREAAWIEWSRVIAINPVPPPLPKWTGSLSAGGNLREGNTDRAAVSVAFEGARKAELHRITLRFRFNYAEDEDEVTARDYYGTFKYDYFFTRKFYGYLAVELLDDEFRDLNLRTVAGPGVGFLVWDDETKLLQFEAGIAYFNEDHIEGDDRHWVTGRVAGDLRYRFDSLALAESLVVYPSFERGGEYELRNEASLSTVLAADWDLKLTSIYERDSDPEAGVRKDDYNWILALDYKF